MARSQGVPAEAVRAESIRFHAGPNLLAGTLYLPSGPRRHPAVALVLGSGPADRQYGGVAAALARRFTAEGIACLTWDKPGVGASSGDYNLQNFDDRANEALAAVRYLRRRPEIRAAEVGLWGHSQGGMVAPLAASRSRSVAFLINVSGWQGPAWKQDQVRVEAELRSRGFPQTDIRAAVDFARRRMELIRGRGPFEELDAAQRQVRAQPWFEAVHSCDRALFASARRNVEYDSSRSWESVNCPVLAIYGDADNSSGAPEPLIKIIRRGLARAGNRNVTVRIFPGADHALCRPAPARAHPTTLGNGRPGDQTPPFVPGYLDLMTAWLHTQTRSSTRIRGERRRDRVRNGLHGGGKRSDR